jgi:formiminotetrahydrofolate cyclodeaminase
MSIVKILDEKDLVKDTESGAVLCVNNKALESYKKRKANATYSKKKYDELKNIINNTNDRMERLENLLIQLIERDIG